MVSQKSEFLRSEGDAWYSRNKDYVGNLADYKLSHDVRFIVDQVGDDAKSINNILEIGCGNGVKLEMLCRSLDARGNGIDPSSLAIYEGNARSKSVDLDLCVGTADLLPFQNSSFDIVFFGFCLYLIDRVDLTSCMQQADRVLRPGGYLIITDFDPGVPNVVPYVHRQGLYSFKQDYASMFIGAGGFYLLAKTSFSHTGARFHPEPSERVSTSILYKELLVTGT